MNKRFLLSWFVIIGMLVIAFSTYGGSTTTLAASPESKIPAHLSHLAQERATAHARWRVVHSPNIPHKLNALFAVTAVTASDVWAVGSYNNVDGTMGGTLIEQWNGTKWKIVPSPNPSGSTINFLNSVAAISASDVWAVGSSTNANNVSQTLVEHWNGTQWSVVPSLSPGTSANELLGVAAVSANDVWAVGDYADSSGNNQALIEQWNGTRWSVVKSPSPPGTISSLLYSVAAVSASTVWAVGYSTNAHTSGQTLIEHWNGTKWNVVPSPNPPGTLSNFLSSVAAVSASAVWAVGFSVYPPGHNQTFYKHQTLVEQWNGTRWSVVKSLNPGTVSSLLNSVTAVSASDVWAVGSSYAGSHGPIHTLIEHWDGSGWSLAKSPSPAYDNALYGVAAISASDVWAVGAIDYITTLVEHYS